ncbi:MAG: hypothetical protein O2877_02085 [bacterium]|nr:hypothetical protein [bacterium]
MSKFREDREEQFGKVESYTRPRQNKERGRARMEEVTRFLGQRPRALIETEAAETEARLEEEKRLSKERHKFFAGYYINRNQRPPLAHFGELHKDNREIHENLVRDRKKQFLEKTKRDPKFKNGNLLESFLRFETEKANWFDASVFQTTEYDDLFNGVDAVLEWEDEEGTIVLAVDFTGNPKSGLVEEKMTRAGRGASVEYFETDFPEEDVDQFSFLNGIPRVVLGVSTDQLQNLMQTAYENRIDTEKTYKDREGKKRKIQVVQRGTFRDHPLRFMLLEQAERQLRIQILKDIFKIKTSISDTPEFSSVDKEISALTSGTSGAKEYDSLFEAIWSIPNAMLRQALGNGGRRLMKRRVAAWSKVNERLAAANVQLLTDEKLAKEVEEWKASKIHKLLTT